MKHFYLLIYLSFFWIAGYFYNNSLPKLLHERISRIYKYSEIHKKSPTDVTYEQDSLTSLQQMFPYAIEVELNYFNYKILDVFISKTRNIYDKASSSLIQGRYESSSEFKKRRQEKSQSAIIEALSWYSQFEDIYIVKMHFGKPKYNPITEIVSFAGTPHSKETIEDKILFPKVTRNIRGRYGYKTISAIEIKVYGANYLAFVDENKDKISMTISRIHEWFPSECVEKYDLTNIELNGYCYFKFGFDSDYMPTITLYGIDLINKNGRYIRHMNIDIPYPVIPSKWDGNLGGFGNEGGTFRKI